VFVGQGLPGGKSLSFASPKESNQRKGDPDIPEFPKTEPAGRAAKNSPRLAVFNWIFVGGAYDSTRALARSGSESFRAQTPSPLIRPAGSVFGGPVRGRTSKQGQWRLGVCALLDVLNLTQCASLIDGLPSGLA